MELYNTLTKKNESIKPIKKHHYKIYVCGITPYANCHIGHIRTFIIFDVLIRYLKYKKNKITYIQNITDIDDKIINCAKKKIQPYKKLTSYYIFKMKKEKKILNILPPTNSPLVTENINYIIKIIIKLFEKKYAYISTIGNVNYNIKKNKKYGILSNRQIENKKTKNDFSLWKKIKKNEPFWDSPFGKGRPGWHIECTAIAKKFLGNNFDIHGGGIDLIFPHHENEIAQWEGIIKKASINIWVHTGLVQIKKKKLSKTKKNYISINILLRKIKADTIRYYLLSKSYRKPLEFSFKKLIQCEKIIKKFYQLLEPLKRITNIKIIEHTIFEKKFLQAIANNIDTPTSLSVLHTLIKKIKEKMKRNENVLQFQKLFKYLANIIGLLLD